LKLLRGTVEPMDAAWSCMAGMIQPEVRWPQAVEFVRRD
jgi:hypothetical protein